MLHLLEWISPKNIRHESDITYGVPGHLPKCLEGDQQPIRVQLLLREGQKNVFIDCTYALYPCQQTDVFVQVFYQMESSL